MKDITLITLDQIDSTNLYLSELASNNKLLPWTVVSTDYQTKGRGQRSNQWHSAKAKNILCSIFVTPSNLLAKQQFYLNIITSLALRDVIQDILKDKQIKIKWPNDVFVDNKKIAGILIQNTLQGTSIVQSIIGVGLNVNENSFPDDLVHVTSCNLLTHQSYDRQKILTSLIHRIQHYFSLMEFNKFNLLTTQYISNLLGLNEVRIFKDRLQSSFFGVIISVNESGQLVVLVNGKEQVYSMKEIEFVL